MNQLRYGKSVKRQYDEIQDDNDEVQDDNGKISNN